MFSCLEGRLGDIGIMVAMGGMDWSSMRSLSRKDDAKNALEVGCGFRIRVRG